MQEYFDVIEDRMTGKEKGARIRTKAAKNREDRADCRVPNKLYL
jgi:hypothetical protein